MSFGYQVLGFGTVAGVPFDATGGTITEAGAIRFTALPAVVHSQ